MAPSSPFYTIPLPAIPALLRESIPTLSKDYDNSSLSVHLVSLTLTPGETPRFTIIDNDSHGMYHDIPYYEFGFPYKKHLLDYFAPLNLICPPEKPVVTNYLEHIPNKNVCIFGKDRKFICHGTYYLSLEWNTEIWHLVLTHGLNFVLFWPTHKLLWNSTIQSGTCKNDHKCLPKWEKQRMYYDKYIVSSPPDTSTA